MLYVLHGDDDFSVRQELDKIKKSIGDDTAIMANTSVLDGQQLALEQLRHACETVPFLADKRLVIVEGLLERFEPRGKPGRKKARQSDAGSAYEPIAAVLQKLPEFSVVVLVSGRVSDRNPLLRALSTGGGQIRSFPLLRNPQKLRAWIEQRVVAGGGSISPEAAGLLAEFVGSNLWFMASEIDKLILFTAGKRIEEEDVRTVVSYVQESSVFSMVDAILEFRGGVAQEILQRLLQQGSHPATVLVLITRQVRILVMVKELIGQELPRAELQSRLGLTSDFLVRKAQEQASKYSMARLVEVYHRLLEADLAIKTGKYDGELALNILLAELGQREKPGTARHSRS